MSQIPPPSPARPKGFKTSSFIILAFLIAATSELVLTASPRPILTFTETLLPGCTETRYIVTRDKLRVSWNGETIASVPTSPGLLEAMSDPAIGSLKDRYLAPETWDGIHVNFRFGSAWTNKEITIENRYVPSLSRILDESNRSLPRRARLHLNDSLIGSRQRLEAFADRMRTNTSIQPQVRTALLEDLHQSASNLPPLPTAAGTNETLRTGSRD